MKARLRKVVSVACIVLLVAAINLVLFSIFPGLHRALSALAGDTPDQPHQRSTVIEYRRPEKKQEPREQTRIRQVATSARGSNPDPMLFRFSPDLAVEGGSGVAMESQDLEAVVFDEGATDEPPVPVYTPPVPYPERANELGITGELRAILTIDRDGRVVSVDVVKTPHPILTSAARKTLSTWRFRPARNKGVPVKIRASLVMDFKLE